MIINPWFRDAFSSIIIIKTRSGFPSLNFGTFPCIVICIDNTSFIADSIKRTIVPKGVCPEHSILLIFSKTLI